MCVLPRADGGSGLTKSDQDFAQGIAFLNGLEGVSLIRSSSDFLLAIQASRYNGFDYSAKAREIGLGKSPLLGVTDTHVTTISMTFFNNTLP